MTQLHGADEVARRVYGLLVQAAGAMTLDHPAAESMGQAIDSLAGWLGERTVLISPSIDDQQARTIVSQLFAITEKRDALHPRELWHAKWPNLAADLDFLIMEVERCHRVITGRP